MSTLQVHITAGPQAGARFQLNQSPVSFGRSPENTLVLDVSVVSRHHGELQREDDGTWVLVNLSQNGTRVGRKKAKNKPVPLTDGASVIIGDTEVFRVYLAEEGQGTSPAAQAAAQQPDAQQPGDTAPGASLKQRSKLWIMLGVSITFTLGLVIFALTLENPTEDTGTAGNIWNPGQNLEDVSPGPEADQTEVRRLLDDPLPPQDPNASRYAQHLEDARAASERGNRGLYDAYRHYQQAISYSDNRTSPLDSLDQIKYDNTLNELSKIIATEYREAWRRFRQGDYRRTKQTLDRLRQDFYSTPDTEDELANHINRLRNAATARSGG